MSKAKVQNGDSKYIPKTLIWTVSGGRILVGSYSLFERLLMRKYAFCSLLSGTDDPSLLTIK